jgi:hypothetical protein
MRGALAAILRSLVLPAGATSGRRIVLDGVNGLIQLYDVNGILRVQLSDPTDPSRSGRVLLFSGAPAGDELNGGDIFSGVLNSGGVNERLFLDLDAPVPNWGTLFPTILMLTQAKDLSKPSEIQLVADKISVIGITGLADITLDTVSLPRGERAFGEDTAAGGAANSGVYVDYSANLAATFTAVAGRRYRVTLMVPRVDASAAGCVAGIAIREGAAVLEEVISNTALAGALTLIAPTCIHEGTFSAGAHTVKASTRLFAGVGTVTPKPAVAGTNHCRITVDDISG